MPTTHSLTLQMYIWRDHSLPRGIPLESWHTSLAYARNYIKLYLPAVLTLRRCRRVKIDQ